MIQDIQLQADLAVFLAGAAALQIILSCGHPHQPQIGPIQNPVEVGGLDVGFQSQPGLAGKLAVGCVGKGFHQTVFLLQLRQPLGLGRNFSGNRLIVVQTAMQLLLLQIQIAAFLPKGKTHLLQMIHILLGFPANLFLKLGNTGFQSGFFLEIAGMGFLSLHQGICQGRALIGHLNLMGQGLLTVRVGELFFLSQDLGFQGGNLCTEDSQGLSGLGTGVAGLFQLLFAGGYALIQKQLFLFLQTQLVKLGFQGDKSLIFPGNLFPNGHPGLISRTTGEYPFQSLGHLGLFFLKTALATAGQNAFGLGILLGLVPIQAGCFDLCLRRCMVRQRGRFGVIQTSTHRAGKAFLQLLGQYTRLFIQKRLAFSLIDIHQMLGFPGALLIAVQGRQIGVFSTVQLGKIPQQHLKLLQNPEFFLLFSFQSLLFPGNALQIFAPLLQFGKFGVQGFSGLLGIVPDQQGLGVALLLQNQLSAGKFQGIIPVQYQIQPGQFFLEGFLLGQGLPSSLQGSRTFLKCLHAEVQVAFLLGKLIFGSGQGFSLGQPGGDAVPLLIQLLLLLFQLGLFFQILLNHLIQKLQKRHGQQLLLVGQL